MQVVVTIDDIAKREKGGRLTLRLKLFADGADTKIANPRFEDTASADIKGNVEGLTRQDLIDRATNICGEQLAISAKDYLRVEDYKKIAKVDAAKSLIETAIGGV